MSINKFTAIAELDLIADIDDKSAQSLIGGQGFSVTRTSGISGINLGTVYEPGRERTVYVGDVREVNITNHAGHRARFRMLLEAENGRSVNLGRNHIFELPRGATRTIPLPTRGVDLGNLHIAQRDPEHFTLGQHARILDQHVCEETFGSGAFCPPG